MEFLDGLVALLERVAAYLVIPVELLLVALVLLALPLLITLLQQARQLKRSREWREELAQLLREGQRQHTRTDKTLAALQQNQTRIAEALLRLAESRQLQEETRREFTQTLSVLAENLAALSQALERERDRPTLDTRVEEPEKIASPTAENFIRDAPDREGAAEDGAGPPGAVGNAEPATADPPPDAFETVNLVPADFTHVLTAGYERELLRLILREDGKPDSDSIRVVLDRRYPEVVRDEINGRAQDALGDILFYEEGDRYVITEEFREALTLFLNERAVPLRRL